MARLLPYFAAVHLALVPAVAKICKASDPALNLTPYSAPTIYYVADDMQLQRMCECTEIDYVHIGTGFNGVESGCKTCRQETMDACRLESITGTSYRPDAGLSLSIASCPLITSLKGLSGLRGALSGALSVTINDNLTTLEGLNHITSIGPVWFKPQSACDIVGLCYSVRFIGNNRLFDVTALSNAGNFTSAELLIIESYAMACVPEQWPVKEQYGSIIRQEPCPPPAVDKA